MRFPQEETGRQRKLSCPWHGPYRIVGRHDPDVTVVKVYAPQDGQLQVHQTRVAHCPPELPCGFFWYGNRRAGPGRLPKWVEQLLQGDLLRPHEGTANRAAAAERPAGGHIESSALTNPGVEPEDDPDQSPAVAECTEGIEPSDGVAVDEEPEFNTSGTPEGSGRQ